MAIKTLITAIGSSLLFTSVVHAGNDIEITSGSSLINVSGSPSFVTTDDSAVLGVDQITGVWSSNINSTISISTSSLSTNLQAGNLTLNTDLDFNGTNFTNKTLSFSALNNININGSIFDSIDPPNNHLFLYLTPDSDAIGGGVVNLNGTIDKTYTHVSGDLNIGSAGVFNGSLDATNVNNSGQVTSSYTTITSDLIIDASGTYTATDRFTAGSVINNGGIFNFTGSEFTLTNSSLAVDSGGLLGSNVTLGDSTGFYGLTTTGVTVGTDAVSSGTFTQDSISASTTISGIMTINSGGTVNLNNGNLTVYSIDNSAGGQFNYTQGVLYMLGGGLVIGNTGLLGANVSISDNRHLSAANLTVESGSNFDVSGGYNGFGGSTSSFIDNYGTTTVTSGFLGTNGAFNNHAGSTFNLNGGELAVGSFSNSGNFNFTAGTLNVVYSDLHLSNLTGGGGSLSIGGSSRLKSNNNIVLGSGNTLSLNGGVVEANNIVKSGGSFNFNSGILSLAQGVNIGSGGLFGTNLSLTSSRQLGAGSINVESGASLGVSGGTQFSYGDITNSGNVNISAGELSAGDGFANYVQNAGSTVVNGTLTAGNVSVFGGTLKGSGTIAGNLTIAGGSLSPGNSPGTLAITGDFVLTPAGTLHLEVGSDGFGGYLWDQLIVSGTYDIQPDSMITISLLDSFNIANLTTDFSMTDFFRYEILGFDIPIDSSTLALFQNASIYTYDPLLTQWYSMTFDETTGAFTSALPVAAVPLPTAAWLFGSGLIGLIGLARRKVR